MRKAHRAIITNSSGVGSAKRGGGGAGMSNRLLAGDNLEIMRALPPASVDLVYCDPPYNTGRDFGDFDDRWASDDAYYDFCRARIEAIHRLLKSTGSLYWHCDPNTSHYIKVMLDGIFGKRNFRNEIVWSYRRWGMPTKAFQRMHDVILYYCVGKATWHQMYEPLSVTTITRNGYGKRIQEIVNGKRKNVSSTEMSLGAPMRDVWDISILAAAKKERSGYPTQKPLALLERIISASSNEGDLILDPFCGSGTTLVAAKRLRRDYIGIDKSQRAIEIATKRLQVQQAPML